MQTVYEQVKGVFENGYDGTKTIVFESKKSKVWIERGGDKAYVYVLFDGKVLYPRWQVGFIGSRGWRMSFVAEKNYDKWVREIKEAA